VDGDQVLRETCSAEWAVPRRRDRRTARRRPAGSHALSPTAPASRGGPAARWHPWDCAGSSRTRGSSAANPRQRWHRGPAGSPARRAADRSGPSRRRRGWRARRPGRPDPDTSRTADPGWWRRAEDGRAPPSRLHREDFGVWIERQREPALEVSGHRASQSGRPSDRRVLRHLGDRVAERLADEPWRGLARSPIPKS